MLILDNGHPIVQQEGGASPIVAFHPPFIPFLTEPGFPKSQGTPTAIDTQFSQSPVIVLPAGKTCPGASWPTPQSGHDIHPSYPHGFAIFSNLFVSDFQFPHHDLHWRYLAKHTFVNERTWPTHNLNREPRTASLLMAKLCSSAPLVLEQRSTFNLMCRGTSTSSFRHSAVRG